MIDVAEPAAPVKRPSHWARKRAAEKLYQDQVDLARNRSGMPPPGAVNRARRQHRANHIAALIAAASAAPSRKFSDRLPAGYGLEHWRIRADGVLCFPDPKGKIGEPVHEFVARKYAEAMASQEVEAAQ